MSSKESVILTRRRHRLSCQVGECGSAVCFSAAVQVISLTRAIIYDKKQLATVAADRSESIVFSNNEEKLIIKR